jgi:hypothetical protein
MRVFLILITLISLVSCENKNEQEKRFLINYSMGLSEFNPNLTDHFPNTIKDERQLTVGYPNSAYAFGMASIILSHNVDSIEFSSEIRKLKLNKIKACTGWSCGGWSTAAAAAG